MNREEITDEMLHKIVVVFQKEEYTGQQIKSKWFLIDVVAKYFLTMSEHQFYKKLNGGIMKMYINDRGNDFDEIIIESLP